MSAVGFDSATTQVKAILFCFDPLAKDFLALPPVGGAGWAVQSPAQNKLEPRCFPLMLLKVTLITKFQL